MLLKSSSVVAVFSFCCCACFSRVSASFSRLIPAQKAEALFSRLVAQSANAFDASVYAFLLFSAAAFWSCWSSCRGSVSRFSRMFPFTGPCDWRVFSLVKSSGALMLTKLFSSGSRFLISLVVEMNITFGDPRTMSSERGRLSWHSVFVISIARFLSRTMTRVSSRLFGHMGTATSESSTALNR